MLHARTGLFCTPIDAQTTLETYRLNGTRQAQLQIYTPVLGAPLTTGSSTITATTPATGTMDVNVGKKTNLAAASVEMSGDATDRMAAVGGLRRRCYPHA